MSDHTWHCGSCHESYTGSILDHADICEAREQAVDAKLDELIRKVAVEGFYADDLEEAKNTYAADELHEYIAGLRLSRRAASTQARGAQTFTESK